MSCRPVPHDRWTPLVAKFTPELRGVAASLAPAPPKEWLERIKYAVARRLSPKGRLAEPQPAMNGLTISAGLGGDPCNRGSDAVWRGVLLVARLSARTGRSACLLCGGWNWRRGDRWWRWPGRE
jgi:hypothetical protein